MTPTETTTILRQFNEWRQGDEDIPQFDPREIGEAIDAAIAMIDRLEAAESDALEQARLNSMGASREASLLTKLEAAEKERDNANAAAVGIALKAQKLEEDLAIDTQRMAILVAELNGAERERDALRAKIEAAERSDAESIAMYRKARDERDAMRIELNEIRYGVAVAHDTIKALRAKIEQMERHAPSIPERWKLVPIEPTPEMVKACASAARAYMQKYGGNSPQVMWAAMLAAAPEAKP